MHSFIHLTQHGTNKPFTIALHAIGTIESDQLNKKPVTAITLSFGSSGKSTHIVTETYEQVLKLIEEAQLPHPL